MGAPCFVPAPLLPAIRTRRGYNGSSLGFDKSALVRAFGELMERTHFVDQVRATGRSKLREAYDPYSAEAFIQAFRQTAVAEQREQVADHAFEMVPAVNLMSGEDTFLPLVTVTLGRCGDEMFLPYRDSTGCACHVDPDKGLDAALLEFYERQCLVAATFSGRCRRVIEAESLASLQEPIATLAAPLMHHGKIRIAEIGFHDGAYVVLSTFEGQPEAAVRYSVGCSASFDPRIALSKSLCELHQGYQFFEHWDHHGQHLAGPWQNGADVSGIDKCNRVDSWRRFGFLNPPADLDAEKFASLPCGAREVIIESLTSVSTNLFAYRAAMPIEDRVMCFFKIVSPDFPMTRHVEHPYNSDNPFFSSIGIGDKPLNMKIPFF